MTGMSLKSPMSGTLTSIVLIVPRGRAIALTVHGAGFSGSIPYFSIASATFAAGIAPSSASAFSAATATYARSTSKKWRSFSRVSERPKPSVPSTT